MNSLAHTSLAALGLTFGLAASTAAPAAAAPVYTETLVHDTTTNVEVELNANTVLCSSADYGALFLKILIPELAKLTLLDHQNTGAGAPCVAAGACQPGSEPSDIIDPAHPTETVAINVKAFRADAADDQAQTCETYLVERVRVTIRGVDFVHERSAPLGSRPFGDCGAQQVAPEPEPEPDPVDPEDDKTDAYGPNDHIESPGGGCSTGGGTPGLFVIAGLAALNLRRRRR